MFDRLNSIYVLLTWAPNLMDLVFLPLIMREREYIIDTQDKVSK